MALLTQDPNLGPLSLPVPPPDYDHAFTYTTNTADTQVLSASDTPGFRIPFMSSVQSVDFTVYFVLYLVWRYPDDSIYTHAYTHWQIRFQLNRDNAGTLVIPNTSVTSADTDPLFVLSHTDVPALKRPIFNECFSIQ
jgi:hypothetical protein